MAAIDLSLNIIYIPTLSGNSLISEQVCFSMARIDFWWNNVHFLGIFRRYSPFYRGKTFCVEFGEIKKRRKLVTLNLQETQDILSKFSDIEDENYNSEIEFLGNQSDTSDNCNKGFHMTAVVMKILIKITEINQAPKKTMFLCIIYKSKYVCGFVLVLKRIMKAVKIHTSICKWNYWKKKIKERGVVGRLPTHCIFKYLSGPTAYYRRAAKLCLSAIVWSQYIRSYQNSHRIRYL